MRLGDYFFNKSSGKKYKVIEIYENGRILLLSPGGVKCPVESKEYLLKYYRYDLKTKLDKIIAECYN